MVGVADGGREVGVDVAMLGAAVGVREGLSLLSLSDGRSEGLSDGEQPKLSAG